MKETLLNILWVGLGGFAGSAARYEISRLFRLMDWVALPYSTFTINITGSLVLGFISEIVLNTKVISPGAALFLTVGVCGGFTTFSTFAYENIMMIRDGQYLYAAGYMLVSVITGIAALFAGVLIAKLIVTG